MNWKDNFIHNYMVAQASKEPWQMTLREFMESSLFHGTIESIDGDLRGGGYDGVFWTAESPAVAQNYIPAAGGTITFAMPYDLNEMITPGQDDVAEYVCEQLGYEYKIYDKDQYGRVRSWSWKDGKSPRMKEVVDYLTNVLGYNFKDERYIQIKTKYEGGKQTLLPADYKATGKLFMLMNRGDLKIFDYSQHNDDLMDPQYHHLSVFKMLEQQGYDGIKISDYTNSKTWGTVGHTSIGLFPSGLKKVKHIDIPATNFDWNENVEDKISVQETKEFKEYHKNQVKQALEEGKSVPPEVLREYSDLVE